MTLKSADDLVARLRAVEKSLSAAEQRKRLRKVATAVKPLAIEAARADLGADAAFTLGRTWSEIPLNVRFTMHGGNRPSLTIHREGRSAGPWRVAEQGRNQGNAGGFAGPGIGVTSGVTLRTKAGKVRKVRARAGRRWNGTTAGKDTWSDAVAKMQPKAAEMFTRLSRDSVRDAFVKGKP